MAEWSIAAVLKTVVPQGTVGSNPTFSAKIKNALFRAFFVLPHSKNKNYMNTINTKSALIFILITICLDSIGLGIIIPSFPTLISETAHVPFSEGSKYFGWVMGAYAFMQFLFSPLIGNLSDRFGRRPILLISVVGMGLDYIMM